MRTRLLRRPALAAALALCTTAIASPALATGNWTPLKHQPPFNADTALLLTNGSVLVHDAGGTPSQLPTSCHFGGGDWWRLDPDSSGE
jgi:hypothetical protein